MLDNLYWCPRRPLAAGQAGSESSGFVDDVVFLGFGETAPKRRARGKKMPERVRMR